MVGFPLLLIPLAIYNIIVFLMPDVSFTDPLVKLTLMSGAEWTVTLSDVLLTLAHPAAARRSHQGRAPRREISHRPSAVADRVRRGRGRIRAVAEVRHLDLFPADGAVAGGFPLRPCLANAAPRRCGGSGACASAKSAPKRSRHRRPSPNRPRAGSATCAARGAGGSLCRRIRAAGSPRTETGAARRHARAASVVPEAASPKSLPWKPRHRRSRHREYSRAAARSARRTSLSTDLDGLPGPEAGAATPDLAGAIGRLRIRQRSPPQAAGLRRLVGGRDQLGDEGRIGPRRRSAATSARTGSPAPARRRPARRG